MELYPGNYVIVPTTFSPGLEGQFLLRICAFANSSGNYLQSDIPRELSQFSNQCVIICIWIKTVSLEMKGLHLDNSIYVQCSKGNLKYSTLTLDSPNSNFDTGFLFYCYPNANDTVQIEVIHPSKFKKDKIVGFTQFPFSKILEKPVGTTIKSNSSLYKDSSSSSVVGTIEYSLSYQNNPYAI